ncbi:sporulation protein [Metabacillus fastidiosus]|uniref:sporulation protein n=1 Tax=Metabacillus fastidiosus TaxID=1458 RepID=UPI003D2ACE11
MLKKFLAKLGKGAAKVDLQFENRPYGINEIIQGEVILKGGQVDQQINKLAVKLMMTVSSKNGQSVSRQVDEIPLTGPFLISKKEERHIPFHYSVPSTLPLSRNFVSYYFDTYLDIEGGFDRTDIDHVIITSSKEIHSIFNAFSQLGFREKATSGKLDTYGQEFEFFPTQLFADQINELEIRFAYVGTGIKIWMEVDCRSNYGEIEAKREFVLSKELLENEDQLVDFLRDSIAETVQQPQLYGQPFSYHVQQSGHSGIGSGIGSMVGGLAIGILGTVLLDEIMDSFDMDEMFEDAEEAIDTDDDDSDFFGMDFDDFSGGDD